MCLIDELFPDNQVDLECLFTFIGYRLKKALDAKCS